MKEVYLVIDKVNNHIFGVYQDDENMSAKDKAIRCCVNLNKLGNYFIERQVLR